MLTKIRVEGRNKIFDVFGVLYRLFGSKANSPQGSGPWRPLQNI